MKISIYPGSFDPITYGHIDIIKRALNITDKLIIGILNNPDKKPLFSVEERIEMIKDAVKGMDNIEVKAFDGLLVDFATKNNAKIIIRGLRAVTDFEYELQLAQTNREIVKDIDTAFLVTNIHYSYLSSSTVKELASYGADISNMVTPFVEEKLKIKYSK